MVKNLLFIKKKNKPLFEVELLMEYMMDDIYNNVIDHYYNEMIRKLNLNVYWSEPPFVHKIRRKSTAENDD